MKTMRFELTMSKDLHSRISSRQMEAIMLISLSFIACVAGVRRGGKGERRASEAREEEDRTRGHFDFLPPFLRPATQAISFKSFSQHANF